MPKWKEGETEFPVTMNFNKKRGYQSTIPKPIVKALGKPDRIKFIIKKDRVFLEPDVETTKPRGKTRSRI